MTTRTGTIPFEVDGETHQTWFKTIGDVSDRSHTPVVVLHGGPGFSHDYLIPHIDLYTKSSIPVILYDQLGNSRSTHLPDKPKEFWTIDLFINELANVLRHFQIQDKYDLIGHSWGGILSMEFVIRNRPEVAGLQHLVLTNSVASVKLWQASNSQQLSFFPDDVQAALKSGRDANVLAYREALLKFYAVHACTVTPTPEEMICSFDQNNGVDADRSVMNAMGAGDLKDWSIIDRLHLIKVPTFIINGPADLSQDFVVAPLFWGIPKAKWITIESSSHMPFWETRERYMELVAQFLLK